MGAMDAVRKLILERVENGPHTLASLSKAAGKNHSYLQQFIGRGVPAKLPEDVRAKLAVELRVDEVDLGGAKPKLESRDGHNVAGLSQFIRVPEHDVRASAGPGTIVEDETEVAEWSLPQEYVRRTLSLRSGKLAMIEVVGDSMGPTLLTGDKILVDLGDQNVANPGVFVLYDGDATVVKRVEKVPGTAELQLISDNPLHSNYRVPADTVNVAGRVVWFGRRL
jgi:phage repressor protein C with HTH and peptisase S24 domain